MIPRFCILQVESQGVTKFVESHQQATANRGLDLILKMLANRNLANDLTLLAPHGRVVIIGSRGRMEIDTRDAMTREADIRGMVLANTPPEELALIHAALGEGLQNAILRPVIARGFKLAEASLAHVAVMQPGAVGKIILTP